MNMLKTYKHKYRKGDMPGDQCVSWWTQEDWDRWNEYVDDLKASGEYGKEEEVEISLWHDAAFDDQKHKPLKESYTYDILDLSNDSHTDI